MIPALNIQKYIPEKLLLLDANQHHNSQIFPLFTQIFLGLLFLLLLVQWSQSNIYIFLIALITGILFAIIKTIKAKTKEHPVILLKLEANFSGDSLEIFCFRANSYTESERIPFASIKKISLVHQRKHKSSVNISLEEKFNLPVKIIITADKTFELHCNINKINSRDKLLDLGKRLARILRLEYGKIVVHDLTIARFEFHKNISEKSPHVIDMTYSKANSLEEWYAQDFQDKQLATVVCAEWNPIIHSFRGKTLQYTPKNIVIIQEPRVKISFWLELLLIPFFPHIGLAAVLMLLIHLPHIETFLLSLIFGKEAFTLNLIVSLLISIINFQRQKDQLIFWKYNLKQKTLTKQKGEIEIEKYDLSLLKEIKLRRVNYRKFDKLSHFNHQFEGYSVEIVFVGDFNNCKKIKVGETGNLYQSKEEAYQSALAFSNIITEIIPVPVILTEHQIES